MPTDYHGRIMDIEAYEFGLLYKNGHRDARHAAAEIALEADAEIARLRTENKRLVDHCAALGIGVMNDDIAPAHESWRAMPDDLRDKINLATEALESGDE